MRVPLATLTLLAAVLSLAGTAMASDRYVDCSAPTAGDGSIGSPLNQLGSGFVLAPGDRLLLKRGTECAGRLRLTGSGSETQPTTVTAYGNGELPRIVGDQQDAVLIEDVSHLEVRDLDISNPGTGGPLGESDQIRNGLRVVAQSGPVSHLTIKDLKIHDVDGDLTKNPQGSAGIQISADGPPPARFVDLRIENNQISSVSRSAISITGTNDTDRPDAGQPWPEASTGVEVRGNQIDLIAGDGIVPRGTDGALVEGNVVSRGNLAGRPLLDPAGPLCNAGIWAFRANNTVIRGNEVFGMQHNGCDGTGFDVDYRQDGTVIEGNYSHDNEGGFVLLCTDNAIHRADVRFNLSVDDGTMINHGPCGVGEGIIGSLSGIRMFNNTVVGDTPTASIQLSPVGELYEPGDFVFANNVVYARQRMAAVPCGSYCSHNAFYNLPASGSDAVTADPELDDRFRPGPKSPLHGAGIQIPSPGEVDYFGNQIPEVPTIGFDQAPPQVTPGPSGECLKARRLRDRAKRKAIQARRRLTALRRTSAKRDRVRVAVRQSRRATLKARRLVETARRACRAV